MVVVLGPPCSGKTTFVRERSGPADVVIDFDTIAAALGSTADHDHHPAHLAVAFDAREAAIARAVRETGTHTVWIILTSPSQLALFGLADANVHTMDTPLAECERRAVAAGRTDAVLGIIRAWRTTA